MKCSRVLPILMLVMLVLGGLPVFTPGASAVYVLPGVYFTAFGGQRNYTVERNMTFSTITITTSYVEFNNTGIVPYGLPTWIGMEYLDHDPATTVAGQLVLEFNYTSADASNYFWIDGFKNTYVYHVDRNNVTWSNFTTDGSGVLGFTTTIIGTVNVKIYDNSAIADTTAPTITINYAGNHSDKGGPYWLPPGETTALSGTNLNGYYTNSSYQNESWMYINCSITDGVGVSYTRLHWHNETTGTWYNITGLVKRNTNYYDYNTSVNITNISIGHKYSFDIYAYDAAGNIRKVYWNKTDIGSDITRRYVHLKNPHSSIEYKILYLNDQKNYSVFNDANKRDRFFYDQGTSSFGRDIGFLSTTIPTDTVKVISYRDDVGGWYNNSSCITPFTLTNIYYHLWYSFEDIETSLDKIGWIKTRSSFSSGFTDYYVAQRSSNKSSIYYNNGLGGSYSTDYLLDVHKLTTTATAFTDNDIYEGEFLGLSTGSDYPSVVSNRSFMTFILLNVPSNVTLMALDSDHDNLSDYLELYFSFTNPFLQDTDNDGYNDTVEYYGGSDQNNYLNFTSSSATVPTVTTNESTNVEETTATLNGYLVNDGGAATGETENTIFSPDDAGDTTGLTSYGATPNWNAVDEYPIPEDGNYVAPGYTGSAYRYDYYNIPNHNPAYEGTIHEINITFRVLKATTGGSSAYAKPLLWLGLTAYYGTEVTLTTTATNHYYVWTTNPSTGLAWTWADIDSLQIGIGVKHVATTNYYGKCTQMYLAVVNDEIASDVNFEYGPTISYGTETAEHNKKSGESFFEDLTGLSPGTLYHFRANATNIMGTSYGIDRSFVTKPTEPTGLTITNTGVNNIQQLSWVHGLGYNNTVIRAKVDGPTYPVDPYSDTGIYNGSGTSTTVNNTFLLPGRLYYYRAWEYASWGALNQFSDSYSSTIGLTKPYAPTDGNTNLISFNATNRTMNFTWVKGDGANYTRLIYKTTGYPTSPSDGTIVYNDGTGSYVVASVPIGPYYIRAYSFTSWGSRSTWSDNGTSFTNSTIGGFVIYAYDQETLANLTFTMLMTNPAGTDTYQQTGCTNPHFVNSSLCVHGDNIQILISSPGYGQMQYVLNIYEGIIYTLNTYLPKIYSNGTEDCYTTSYIDYFLITNPLIDVNMTLTKTVKFIDQVRVFNSSASYWEEVNYTFYPGPNTINISSWNLDDNSTMARVTYYYELCGNVTNAFVYYFQVIVDDPQGITIKDAYVEIKKYINTTGYFTTVSSMYTDSNGNFNLYMIPGTLYKIVVTKTGYQDEIVNFIPADQNSPFYPIIIKMTPGESGGGTTPTYDLLEKIHIAGYLDNSTSILYVNYTDDLNMTLNCQIYVYDMTNGTLMLSYSCFIDSHFQVQVTVNNTHDFEVVYKFNHTFFGYKAGSFIVTGWHRTITTMGKFNLLFTMNFGWNPFGWSNFITWFIMLGCFFSFSRRDTYMIMFLAGFILLILNYYIGFNTTMSVAAGGAIPIIMIFFGILMLIRDRYRFGVDL